MAEGNVNTKEVTLFYSVHGIEFGSRRLSETMNCNVCYDNEFNYRVIIEINFFENLNIHLENLAFRIQNRQLHNYEVKRRSMHLKQLHDCIIDNEIKEEMLIYYQFLSKECHTSGIFERDEISSTMLETF